MQCDQPNGDAILILDSDKLNASRLPYLASIVLLESHAGHVFVQC